MGKNNKVFMKTKIEKILAILIIILIILVAGFFAYKYFFTGKANNYLIENKYYGFKLQTPKGWIARENTVYSQDNIAQLLAACKNNKSTGQVGDFRFDSQRYPETFGDSGYKPSGLSSGVVLEIMVNCVSDDPVNSSSNLVISGEKASENILNSPEFGKTNLISFFHNDLQYKIAENIYVSPADKNNEASIRENYAAALNKIISSIELTK